MDAQTVREKTIKPKLVETFGNAIASATAQGLRINCRESFSAVPTNRPPPATPIPVTTALTAGLEAKSA